MVNNDASIVLDYLTNIGSHPEPFIYVRMYVNMCVRTIARTCVCTHAKLPLKYSLKFPRIPLETVYGILKILKPYIMSEYLT